MLWLLSASSCTCMGLMPSLPSSEERLRTAKSEGRDSHLVPLSKTWPPTSSDLAVLSLGLFSPYQSVIPSQYLETSRAQHLPIRLFQRLLQTLPQGFYHTHSDGDWSECMW